MNRYCCWNPGFSTSLSIACVPTGIDVALILHVRLFYAFFYIIKLHDMYKQWLYRYKTGYKLLCIMSYVLRIFCKIKD